MRMGHKRVARSLSRPLLAGGIVLAVVACVPPIILPRGSEIALDNESGENRVAEVELLVQGQIVPRFYPSTPHTTLVLAVIGEGTYYPEAIVILDPSCAELERIDRDFTDGATITMDQAGHVTVSLGRDYSGGRPMPDTETGYPTCEAAIPELTAP